MHHVLSLPEFLWREKLQTSLRGYIWKGSLIFYKKGWNIFINEKRKIDEYISSLILGDSSEISRINYKKAWNKRKLQVCRKSLFCSMPKSVSFFWPFLSNTQIKTLLAWVKQMPPDGVANNWVKSEEFEWDVLKKIEIIYEQQTHFLSHHPFRYHYYGVAIRETSTYYHTVLCGKGFTRYVPFTRYVFLRSFCAM